MANGPDDKGSGNLETSLLEEIGLGRPFATEMADRLREQGLPLPTGLLTVDQLVMALC